MNSRLWILTICAFSILSTCTVTKQDEIQTPTQCVWVYRDFEVDAAPLIKEFNTAGIPVVDVEITGNGEGGNCSSGYGNAWVVISLIADDSGILDPESLGLLLAKVVKVIDQWAKTTPPAEVYNFSESSLFLNISFTTSTGKVSKPYSEILGLQQQGLTPSEFWHEVIK